MSGIPEPARPAPRRRNTFAQAAQSLKADDAATADTATTGDATHQRVAQQDAAVAQQTRPVAQQPKKRKIATTDILLSLSEDLKDRMVATLEHTRPRTGITSQQAFIRTAIEQLCKRLEADFNDGQPFPPPVQSVNL